MQINCLAFLSYLMCLSMPSVIVESLSILTTRTLELQNCKNDFPSSLGVKSGGYLLSVVSWRKWINSPRGLAQVLPKCYNFKSIMQANLRKCGICSIE